MPLANRIYQRSLAFLVIYLLLQAGSAANAESSNALPQKSWSLTVGASDSSPAVAEDGTIYFGTLNNKLYAVSSNGIVKWTFSTDSEIRSSPAIGNDGTVFFGSRDQNLYAVTPDGKKKWSFKTDGWVDSSPALGIDGTIVIGSWDKHIYAIHPDGSLKWKFQTDGNIQSSAAIDAAENIYIGSDDRKLYAFAPDGTKRWEFVTGGQIISSPALTSDGTIYFTSLDGFFYALNTDGQLKWKLHTGAITESSPAIGENGTIYLGVNNSLWTITPEGKKIKESGFGYAIYASPAVLAGDRILLVSHFGDLRLLNNGHDGEFLYLHLYGHASPGIGKAGCGYVSADGVQFYEVNLGYLPSGSSWWKLRANERNTGHVNIPGTSP